MILVSPLVLTHGCFAVWYGSHHASRIYEDQPICNRMDPPITNIDQFLGVACAASIFLSAIFMPLEASAFDGKIVEGPSNAEMLELTLQPGEQVITETGTLLYMSNHVKFHREYRGDDTVKRLLQGARVVMNTFQNGGTKPAKIALTTPFPSRIVPVSLESQPGNTIIGNLHSFLAASYGVEMVYTREALRGLNILRAEKVTGRGTVYLSGSGNILEKSLASGEKLKLYPGAWVAMTQGIQLDYVRSRDSIFAEPMLQVEGPGTIWIDTAPISRIIDEISDQLPSRD